MIIDTHCHYNLEPLLEEWPTYWQKAQENTVTKSIVVGASLESSQVAVEIAANETNLFASVAIHPSEYQEAIENKSANRLQWDQEIKVIDTLASQNKVVAIGETGLDYFRLPKANPSLAEQIKTTQQQYFKQHLELAQTHHLPVIIHVRDSGDTAYSDVLSILKTDYKSEQPFILHCVSGPLQYIKEAVALGAYIGIAGNSTYPKADHIRSLIKSVPADRLLLETDAPFLPPQDYRGQICEPWMIRLTAEFWQEQGLDLAQLEKNAATCFSFG